MTSVGNEPKSNIDRFNETNIFHVEGFSIRDHLEGHIGLATQAISSRYPSDMCLVGRATSRLVTGLHSDLDDFYIKIDRFDEKKTIRVDHFSI